MVIDNNIYHILHNWINDNTYENNSISDRQYFLLKKENLNTNLKQCKKFIYYKEDNKNYWILYNYYLSPIFLLYYPEELVPFVKWKIKNIEQRI
tara:strand:- start:12 stop:293 length:282 start_codon:yes stop_codon:yes gene_type:complete